MEWAQKGSDLHPYFSPCAVATESLLSLCPHQEEVVCPTSSLSDAQFHPKAEGVNTGLSFCIPLGENLQVLCCAVKNNHLISQLCINLMNWSPGTIRMTGNK